MIELPVFDPVIFRIGPFAARWYGFMYALGFASAWLLGRYRTGQEWRGWQAKELDDLITWLIVGLVVGARAGYVLFYDPVQFWDNPADIIAVWKGGMSFHGGAIGVAVVGLVFAKRTGKSLLEVGDFIAPLAPPGLFAGRIGNFINAELWGRPTDLPWGVVYPGPISNSVPRHPSQLYEAGLEGIVLFTVVWIYSRKPRQTGAVLGVFLMLYGFFRFSVEFVRQPDTQLGFIAFDWLTMGQILSLPMILLGGWLLFRKGRE